MIDDDNDDRKKIPHQIISDRTRFSRELATVSDLNRLGGPSTARTDLLNGPHHIHPLHNLTEHAVLTVEPLGLGRANEELRSVGVRTGVGHGQDSRTGVLPHEVLIGEFSAVDRLATGAVSGGEVATLAHEAGDDSVEGRALVVEGLTGLSDPLLAGAECTEVLGGLRNDVGEELHHDPAGGLATDGHVEEHLRVRHFSFGYGGFLGIF